MIAHGAAVHVPLALAVLLPPLFILTWIGIERKKLTRLSWFFPWCASLIQIATSEAAVWTGSRDKILSAGDTVLVAQHETYGQYYLYLSCILFLVFTVLLCKKWPARVSLVICFCLVVGFILQTYLAFHLGHLGGQILEGS